MYALNYKAIIAEKVFRRFTVMSGIQAVFQPATFICYHVQRFVGISYMKRSHSHELKDTIDNSYKDDDSLRESLNHLKEINKKLITKYNNQREFVSMAAHELRSPIMPILGTLELIEYEFEESDKKEIKLQREHFERLVRNTKRLERLASAILDVTKIEDQSLRLTKEYFNLNKAVLAVIRDHKRQLEKSNASTKLLYEFKIEEEEEIPTRQDNCSPDIFINADKIRINHS